MQKKIDERSFDFGLRIVKLVQFLPQRIEGWELGKQVLRSGTSIGANVEEGQAAYTKDDFCYRMNVALKEARETHYWLRLISASDIMPADRLGGIIAEADEIKRILGAIVRTSRKKSNSMT
jgi:four helix bundle protein